VLSDDREGSCGTIADNDRTSGIGEEGGRGTPRKEGPGGPLRNSNFLYEGQNEGLGRTMFPRGRGLISTRKKVKKEASKSPRQGKIRRETINEANEFAMRTNILYFAAKKTAQGAWRSIRRKTRWIRNDRVESGRNMQGTSCDRLIKRSKIQVLGTVRGS